MGIMVASELARAHKKLRPTTYVAEGNGVIGYEAISAINLSLEGMRLCRRKRAESFGRRALRMSPYV